MWAGNRFNFCGDCRTGDESFTKTKTSCTERVKQTRVFEFGWTCNLTRENANESDTDSAHSSYCVIFTVIVLKNEEHLYRDQFFNNPLKSRNELFSIVQSVERARCRKMKASIHDALLQES